MTYQEFKTEYQNIFKRMMSYSPNECGSTVYAEKLANLADKYPAYEEELEAEFA